ncbi:hypothetical protein AAC387_Pa05g2755 [Persea americana]
MYSSSLFALSQDQALVPNPYKFPIKHSQVLLERCLKWSEIPGEDRQMEECTEQFKIRGGDNQEVDSAE